MTDDTGLEMTGMAPAPEVKHPLENVVYQQQLDGLVRVEDFDTGRVGYFDRHGHHVRGDLKYCDPQLLHWIAGRPLPDVIHE